jgi:predicted phage replisome organizer
MADVKWIKVSTEMFDSNRKIKQIETMPEGDTILVIWLKLLLLAGNINDDGAIYLTPEIPYTEEMLATELRRPVTTVRMALSVFEQFGMIEIVDNILYLSAWEKYQSTDKLAEIRKQTRERVAKCREKKRLEAGNVTCNATVTLCNAVEEEGEKDKEKEIHSINHSTRESLKLKYLGGSLGGDVVMLSDEQFESLCDMLSLEELDKYIGIVRDCERNGKRFKKKSHYQAIVDMVEKDRKV